MRELEILLVEDDQPDVRWMQITLQEVSLPHRLHVARDGEAAINLLRHVGPFQSAPVPDIVFLDLNLPKIDGWDVLQEVTRDERLSTIPICVLSGSQHELTRVSALTGTSAIRFVHKPITAEKLKECLCSFHSVSAALDGWISGWKGAIA